MLFDGSEPRLALRLFHIFAIFEKHRKTDGKRDAKSQGFLMKKHDFWHPFLHQFIDFFRKWQNQSTLVRPSFGSKNTTFRVPFGIDFSTFSKNGESVK